MRILIVLLGIIVVFALLHLYFHRPALRRPAIISHRGAGGLAPENTLVGIEAALAQQAPLVEVDVRRSQDGVLLLLHDRTVDRTTDGRGAVHTLPWSAIQKLDAGRHFSPAFVGTPVPTLEAALALIKGKPVKLVIELKDTHLYPGIEQAVAAAIQRHELTAQVMIVSFQPQTLATLRQLMPEVAQGALTLYPIARWHNASTAAPTIVSVYWPSVVLDPSLVYRLHSGGYQVWVWTVNRPWLMRFLHWIGVDGITTDRPDLAAAG